MAIELISRLGNGALRWRPDQSTETYMTNFGGFRTDLPKTSLSSLSTEQNHGLEQVYTLLALLCEDEAAADASSAEDGNGQQALRAQSSADICSQPSGSCEPIVRSTFHVRQSESQLATMAENSGEHPATFGEMVSEQIKICIYLNEIALHDISQRLLFSLPKARHF